MRVYETFRPMDRDDSNMATLSEGRSGGYGLGSWATLMLALVSVGVSAWAWVNNDDIVAWGLSAGLVQEASTRALPGTVQNSAVVGVMLGVMVATLSVPAARLSLARTLGYLSVVVSTAAGVSGRATRFGWRGVAMTGQLVAFGLVATSLSIVAALTYSLRSAISVEQAIASPIKAGWLFAAPALKRAALVIASVALFVWKVMRIVGSGISTALVRVATLAGRALRAGASLVLGYMIFGLAVMAQVIAVAMFVSWTGTSFALKQAGKGVDIADQAGGVVVRVVGSRISTAFGYPVAVFSFVIHVVARGMGVLLTGTSIVLSHAWTAVGVTGRALGLSARALFVAAGATFDQMREGMGFIARVTAQVTRLASRSVLAGVGILGGPVAAATRTGRSGVVAGLGLLSLGFATAAPVVVSAVRAIWTGVRMTLAFIWHALSATAQIAALILLLGWTLVSAASRLGWAGVAAAASVVALASRTIWTGVHATLGLLWLVVVASASVAEVGLGYLWRGTVYSLRHVWTGAALVSRGIGLLLRMVWTGVVTALDILLFGLSILAHVTAVIARLVSRSLLAGARVMAGPVATVSRAGRSGVIRGFGLLSMIVAAAAPVVVAVASTVWIVAYVTLGLLWLAVAMGGHAAASLARIGWQGISVASLLVWRGVVAAAYIVAVFLTYALRWVVTGLRHLATGAATIARYGALLMLAVWKGTVTVFHYLLLGIYLVARGLYGPMALAWKGVALSLVALWSGIATVLRPVVTGASAIARLLMLGVGTAVLATASATRYLGRGTVTAGQGVSRTPSLAARTVSTAYDVSPDVWKWFVWMLGRKKGDLVMSDIDFNRERLTSLVVTVVVFFTVGAVGLGLFWPAPPEPEVEVVHWATGHLFRNDMLPNMAAKFNEARHRTASGTLIVVSVHNDPSSLQADDLLSRVTTGTPLDSDLPPLVVPLAMLVRQAFGWLGITSQLLVPAACIPANCVA